ncbi:MULTISPECIES: EutN/CcmL family microcompartment protein [unclassified Agarivorans]|uniref:EutN/CcmL family microcompartment protein n=1 Tax=unclassified Agarivorans TaxID=2636026 RepID=UPI003D7EA10C
MQLAKVVGSVVSTQKSPSLVGKKLLIVRRVNGDQQQRANPEWSDEIAVDCVGAGEGELVFVTRSSSARMIVDGANEAVDLAVCGIVDSLSYQQGA